MYLAFYVCSSSIARVYETDMVFRVFTRLIDWYEVRLDANVGSQLAQNLHTGASRRDQKSAEKGKTSPIAVS